ncbi:MAG: hypothetical protein K6G25_08440 [Bacteroidales bacterium]|nr:hypothetical protein [Bacteroidales bacterium]
MTKPLSTLLALLLLTTAVMTGHQAMADSTFQVGVGILGKTNGSQSSYVIGRFDTPIQYGPINGTEKSFDQNSFNIGSNEVPITMTLSGTLVFANSSSMTDVTTNDFNFHLTFTSTTKYFSGASVTTKAGNAVSGCSVSGRNSQTLTVTIPKNTSFGIIILTMATHTPLNYCIISGIEASYIDDGVNQPVPTVTLEGQTLQQGVDYTLSYTYGNTTGYVTVTGTGEYIGEKTQSFRIREPNLSDFNSLGTDIYEIASQQDLDYLARIVNGNIGNTGNNCSGVTFRQTADIAYSSTSVWDEIDNIDNNFTPIGGYGKSFNGTYDGQGHTISGIRVKKTGTSNNASSLGLFGYISGYGTVKNVVLNDANIEGNQNIGGLVGFIDNGSVTDCYLYHVRVHSTYDNHFRSIIVGNKGGTVTHTHYRDCCEYYLVESQYNPNHHNVYLSTVFTLTADANVVLPTRTGGTVVSTSMTTYTDGITLSGTQYYTEGAEIALTYNSTVPTGQWPRFTATNGNNEDKTAELIDGATLTMPAYDVVVHCDQLLPIFTYIDGDGIEQQCSNYTPITSSSGDVTLGTLGTTRWYVVGSNATITGNLQIRDDNVHLILCDGATLNSNEIRIISGNFTIYGQQQGNGALNAVSTENDVFAINAFGDIIILGGIINVTSTRARGINAGNGGTKTITLGWTRPANRITATGDNGAYRCAMLKVKDGQTLWDGSEVLSGTITGSIRTLNGKTLQPCITREVAGYGEEQDRTKWVFIASPVTGSISPTTVVGLVASTATEYDLYRFNQSTDLEWENYKVHGFNLENGKGYLCAKKDTQTLAFMGDALNMGTAPVKVPLDYKAGKPFVGWNLLGNPFTVAATIDKSYFVIDTTGTTVMPAPASLGTTVPPCTGVMVQAEGVNDTVIFSTTPIQQTANQGLLNITLTQVMEPANPSSRGTKQIEDSTPSQSSLLDKAIVSFNEGDQLAKFVFNKDNAKIYMPQGGKDYAIACVSDGTDVARNVSTNEVPINFEATENGTYTITVNPEGVELGYLHLIDNITGADIDLLDVARNVSTVPSYTFHARTTDYASRFRLVFSVCGDANGDNAPFAFIDASGNIVITGVADAFNASLPAG